MLSFLQNEEANIMVVDTYDKCIMAVKKNDSNDYEVAEIDEDSLLMVYAHDLLFLLEKIVGNLQGDKIEGTIRNNVNYDGVLHLGKGSVLLPGVYIEGNIVVTDGRTEVDGVGGRVLQVLHEDHREVFANGLDLWRILLRWGDEDFVGYIIKLDILVEIHLHLLACE